MKKTATLTAAITLLLLMTSTPAFCGPYDVPSTIPDTGQTLCYDEDGTEIDCTGTGQDGETSNNPMSFTSLGGGTMVQDNVTGLIWEVKTNSDGTENYDDPHDADNTYTWYDPDTATNGGDAGTASTNDTLDFITALNNAAFGGYTDWRLPSREELQSIVDCSIPYPGPTINTKLFLNTVSSWYWSSTTRSYDTDGAWGVYFHGGNNNDYLKSSHRYVRAVRGGQSTTASRFIDNSDGTVSDTRTGLVWEQKTDDGGLRDKDNTYTWQEA